MIQGPAAVSNSRYDRPKVSPVKKPRLALVPDAVVVQRVAGRVDEDAAAGRRARASCRRAVGTHALGRRPAPAFRTSARSRPRRRPRSRSRISWAGSIMCRAPRGCTTSRALRQLLHQQARRRRRGRGARGSAMTKSTASRVEPGGGERGEQARHARGWCRCRRRRRGRARRSGRRRRTAAGESRCRRRGCRAAAIRRSRALPARRGSGRSRGRSAGRAQSSRRILESACQSRTNADGSEFDAANGDEIMDAIDRCARRVAVFLLVAAGLVACATMAPGGLPLGTPIATARQSLIGTERRVPAAGRRNPPRVQAGAPDLHARLRRRAVCSSRRSRC